MLTKVYLTSLSRVPYVYSSTFIGTPIGGYSDSAGTFGSVYVPESLYSDFIVAPNWSDVSADIVSMTSAEIAALEF